MAVVVDAGLEGIEDGGLEAVIDAGLGVEEDASLGADEETGLEGVMEAAIDAGLGVDECTALEDATDGDLDIAGLGAAVVEPAAFGAPGSWILIFPDPPLTLPVFERAGAGKEADAGTAAGSIVRPGAGGGAEVYNNGAGGGSTG